MHKAYKTARGLYRSRRGTRRWRLGDKAGLSIQATRDAQFANSVHLEETPVDAFAIAGAAEARIAKAMLISPASAGKRAVGPPLGRSVPHPALVELDGDPRDRCGCAYDLGQRAGDRISLQARQLNRIGGVEQPIKIVVLISAIRSYSRFLCGFVTTSLKQPISFHERSGHTDKLRDTVTG